MKEFMLIYKGGDPDWMENTSEEDMAAELERWGAWMGKLQAKDQLGTGGSPLHTGGKTISNDGVVTDIAASELKELITGYSIIKANHIEEAVMLAKECPALDAPSGDIEVREVMQLPQG